MMQAQQRDTVKLYQHGPAWGLESSSPECLTAHAYLRFVGFDVGEGKDNCYTPVSCNNDNMSPNGELPFLRRKNDSLVVGLDNIVKYCNSLGKTCAETNLGRKEKALTTPYISLVQHALGKALAVERYLELDNLQYVTIPKILGSQHPFPLDYIFGYKEFLTLKLTSTDKNEVYSEAESALLALSEQLGDKDYFGGDAPIKLDAYAYAYLATILACELPCAVLKSKLDKVANLTKFVERIKAKYFT
eukprot:m.338465 g.338465  ORF g.338465 m.338465 type:complete len:246 (+) comp18427_c0_seq1:212-949(+)